MACQHGVTGSPLVLGRWHSCFDPLRERVTKRHPWVLLPSLPFPLWNLNILEGIANTIGRFVAVDEDFHLSFDKRMARVLVEFDISHGLPAEVEILCKERLLVQKLDYLHMPFHCSRCQEIRHLRCSCPSLMVKSLCSSIEGSLVVREPTEPYALDHPIFGIYSHSLPLFEDVSDTMLVALDGLVNDPPSVALDVSVCAHVDALILLPSP